ncbi:MAG TPA: hypothetical protein VNA25_00250 [Phycisphaerae bacterium]|nr:hypothetical protein [Phycisphaerae bacterium]
MMRFLVLLLASAFLCACCAVAVVVEEQPAAKPENPYTKWTNGLSQAPDYFPIAVWLQDPAKAARYKDIGINLYVGLWQGPTAKQIGALEQAGMPVICDQNEYGLQYVKAKKDKAIIVAWMHGDEPDNAQGMEAAWKNSADAANKAWPDTPNRTLQQWGRWGPPIPPSKIIADYKRIKKADPTRPVIVNLGQGVAWDKWHGRGIRTNHPEDYLQYIKGCDIVSYDIYPVNATHADVKDKLWLVPFGVDRLLKWSKDERIVWNVIECTQYGKGGRRPTPREVKAQVWMSLVRGSRGLIYFVHEFEVKDDGGNVVRPFTGAGLLRDKEMAHAVGEINRRIHALGAVLNTPTIANGATASSSNSDVPVDAMVKKHGGATYLFAVAMRDSETTATFQVKGVAAGTAEVLGEGRTVPVKDGVLKDAFKGYEVHLYKMK